MRLKNKSIFHRLVFSLSACMCVPLSIAADMALTTVEVSFQNRARVEAQILELKALFNEAVDRDFLSAHCLDDIDKALTTEKDRADICSLNDLTQHILTYKDYFFHGNPAAASALLIYGTKIFADRELDASIAKMTTDPLSYLKEHLADIRGLLEHFDIAEQDKKNVDTHVNTAGFNVYRLTNWLNAGQTLALKNVHELAADIHEFNTHLFPIIQRATNQMMERVFNRFLHFMAVCSVLSDEKTGGSD